MENSEGQGYVSEKILDSLMAGTIPIYYGGYLIDEFINPKAIILIRGENDMKEKIEYIKKIDNDDDLYRSILKESLFINDNLVEINKKEKIEFFRNAIFNVLLPFLESFSENKNNFFNYLWIFLPKCL